MTWPAGAGSVETFRRALDLRSRRRKPSAWWQFSRHRSSARRDPSPHTIFASGQAARQRVRRVRQTSDAGAAARCPSPLLPLGPRLVSRLAVVPVARRQGQTQPGVERSRGAEADLGVAACVDGVAAPRGHGGFGDGRRPVNRPDDTGRSGPRVEQRVVCAHGGRRAAFLDVRPVQQAGERGFFAMSPALACRAATFLSKIEELVHGVGVSRAGGPIRGEQRLQVRRPDPRDVPAQPLGLSFLGQPSDGVSGTQGGRRRCGCVVRTFGVDQCCKNLAFRSAVGDARRAQRRPRIGACAPVQARSKWYRVCCRGGRVGVSEGFEDGMSWCTLGQVFVRRVRGREGSDEWCPRRHVPGRDGHTCPRPQRGYACSAGMRAAQGDVQQRQGRRVVARRERDSLHGVLRNRLLGLAHRTTGLPIVRPGVPMSGGGPAGRGQVTTRLVKAAWPPRPGHTRD